MLGRAGTRMWGVTSAGKTEGGEVVVDGNMWLCVVISGYLWPQIG